MFKLILGILVFGLLGVFARYYLVQFFVQKNFVNFPLGTLAVNLIGSFLIGFVVYTIRDQALISRDWYLPIVVGFLGGFTTFSSFSLEVFDLLEQGRLWISLAYLFGSPILGTAACFAGYGIGRFF